VPLHQAVSTVEAAHEVATETAAPTAEPSVPVHVPAEVVEPPAVKAAVEAFVLHEMAATAWAGPQADSQGDCVQASATFDEWLQAADATRTLEQSRDSLEGDCPHPLRLARCSIR
jgi:hypothetical protein